MQGTYSISELKERISWEHFFHPWKVPAGTDEAAGLKAEALAMLTEYDSKLDIRYILQPFVTKKETDDIIIDNTRIPFLRQQLPNADGNCLCMTDFIDDGDTVCVFATTVQTHGIEHELYDDPYRSLLLLTISDRLAEAAADVLQDDTSKQMGWGTTNIIRPAIGYPSIPDMSINFLLDSICHFEKIGIRLTENGMMQPHSSVSGFMIAKPKARYFSIGPVTTEQIADYAQRRGFSIEESKKYVYEQR